MANTDRKTEMNEIVPVDGFEYCFTVPSGFLVLRRNDKIFVTGNCGKTTFARIVASELGCSDFDFHEYNAALDDKGINTIRNIKQVAYLAPSSGEVKVFFLDECHMLSKPAQEGILKLLESPPKNTFFFLCTTNPESLIATVKSRCAMFQVFPNPTKTILKYLKRVCKNNDFNVEEEHLQKIAGSCDGAMRVAVKLLDMVKDLDDEKSINTIIESGGAVEDMELIEIAKVLLFNDQDPKVKWKLITPILKKYKKDSESSRIQLRSYMNAVLLNSGSLKHANVLACFVDNYFSAGDAGLTLSCFHACKA